MRRFLIVACFVILWAVPSFAQQPDYPKFDFTGAFTVARLDDSENVYGLTAAPAYNFTKHLAVEGDLTYTTKSDFGTRLNLTTYMGGLRYSGRGSRLQPFTHFLFGGSHLSVSGFSDNGVAAKVGGGLDIVATKRVAIRVVQVDYYPIHFGGGGVSNNLAFSFGVRFN